jgi:hypothetical protein
MTELMTDLGISTQVLIAAYVALILITVILGVNRQLVVYHDYTDAALCVALAYLPLVVTFLSIWVPGLGLATKDVDGWHLTPTGWVIAAGEAFIVGKIAITTWADNRSLWRFVMALITKLPLGIIWGLAVIQSIAPMGKTQAQRARNRQSALATLFILTPLMIRLVRHQRGVFRPSGVMPVRQRRFYNEAEEDAEEKPWNLPHEAPPPPPLPTTKQHDRSEQ